VPAAVEPASLRVLPVPVAVPPAVPVLPPVVPVPDVAAPVDAPPALLLELPPAIVPVTSTRCPTYCFRFWLSPPIRRYVDPLVLPEPLAVLPVEPAPVEPAPVAPAPVEPVPVEPAPVALEPVAPLAELLLPVALEALIDACVRMKEPPLEEVPVEPAAPAVELPLPDCRQPVSLTSAPERDPVDPVCPLCPLLPEPLPVVGCCAETPTASAALSIVPKMTCRFMHASMDLFVKRRRRMASDC
jgi:hypothetical protein